MSRSIEPPPLHRYSLRNSKRRLYSGSSSRLMDPEVVEIPPPIRQNSKLIKQKEVVLHDLIDIDKDEDSPDVMFIGETVHCKSNKGKAIESFPDGYDDHLSKELLSNYTFGPSGLGTVGPASGAESSKNLSSLSHNLIILDGHNSDISCDDDDYIDNYSDDCMDVDEYALLQAHFDNVDIPTGVEAPIPWLEDLDKSKKKSVTGSISLSMRHQMQSDPKGHHRIDLSCPSQSLEPLYSKTKGTLTGSSSLQNKRDAFGHPSGMVPPPWLSSEATKSKKSSAAKKHRRSALNLSLGIESFHSKTQLDFETFQSIKKSGAGLSNNSSVNHSDAMEIPPGGEPPFWGYFPESEKDKVRKSAAGLSHSDAMKLPPGDEPPFWGYFPESSKDQQFVPPDQMFDNYWVHDPSQDLKNVGAAASPVVTISDKDRDEILRKFQLFKQFDTVEDTSDHRYTCNRSSSKQPSKNWAKKIQEEWKILEKDLPDSIFVRVYETRMDLLRAVIIGAEGTPYHDGLFFFDVFFPSGYPNVPPQVYYHSGGLRLNPNLYDCGKVCLSLLNTWSGGKNEKWIPGVSTILQVLVSIQGLILNTKPYFNEPGYAHMSGSVAGEMRSLQYNEDTFILSLRTMVYMMRRPPKHFEDFVAGHFCNRAHDILVACKAYMDGAQVGCLVKGGVQDVDEGDKSSSKGFKDSLPGYLDMLVKEFIRIGARDCEEFLSPEITVNKSSSGMPKATKRMLS
ncbi:Ubiquitin-conjugating enzyme like [Quillaja saponaria]|uniref:E2 ubiquitin-conjugating enzyme n=1 Tax=Quillaja saponaria TaxID=32244 RepID=A0AAD7KZH6_QUISA|nr:Ubiquitin-conjugating enzyme like [Quillaja saponaria]